MKVFNHFQILITIFILITSQCLISLCETPTPNNFWNIPEYGQILSPDRIKQPDTLNKSSSTTRNRSKKVNALLTAVEMLSEDPEFDDGVYSDKPEDDDDSFHHPVEYEYNESGSEEVRKNKDDSSNLRFHKSGSNRKDEEEGRGFESSSSSSALVNFLMSPLKPFSQRFQLPSVFGRSKKRKRRRKRPPPKGTRDGDSRFDDGDDDDDEDGFDLHVDSDSSAGHKRKRKRGRRGWWWWRSRGRGRKRRRKPKRGSRKRRPRRPKYKKPKYDDEENYDDSDEYEKDRDYEKHVPLKVTYSSDHNLLQPQSGISFDSDQYNKPDLHQLKETSTLGGGGGQQATFFENLLKLASGGGRPDLFYTDRNTGHSETVVKGQRHFPKSIYDKLPRPAKNKEYRTYPIAPPNHPMRIMRPPLPPIITPFPQAYDYQYENSERNLGGIKTDDQMGTPLASISFPRFPLALPQPNIETNLGLPYQNPPPPYTAPPRPFSAKFNQIPRKIHRLVGLRYRSRTPRRGGLHYTNMRNNGFNYYSNNNGNYAMPPDSHSTPVVPTYGSPTVFHQSPSMNADNNYINYYDNEFQNQLPMNPDQQPASNHLNENRIPKIQPQIIYGKWNPLWKME